MSPELLGCALACVLIPEFQGGPLQKKLLERRSGSDVHDQPTLSRRTAGGSCPDLEAVHPDIQRRAHFESVAGTHSAVTV